MPKINRRCDKCGSEFKKLNECDFKLMCKCGEYQGSNLRKISRIAVEFEFIIKLKEKSII